jgi:hypothetical protein
VGWCILGPPIGIPVPHQLIEIIRREGSKWVLRSRKTGKVLGRHDTSRLVREMKKRGAK